MCAQPNVKEAALVALPDAKLGQRPVAYVTLTDGAADLDKLKAAIAPLVPYDLTAMTVKSLAAFPMTPTGKVAKAQLRQSALAGAHHLLDTLTGRDWRSVCNSMPPARNENASWLRARHYPRSAAGKPCC